MQIKNSRQEYKTLEGDKAVNAFAKLEEQLIKSKAPEEVLNSFSEIRELAKTYKKVEEVIQ